VRKRLLRALPAGLAAVATAACYAYAPLRQPVPIAGQEVRATFAAPASLQLGDVTLNAVDRVEGLVQRVSGDSMLVSGDWVFTRLGARYAASGGTLLLDRPQLRALEVRRLSPTRTGVASAVAVGAVVLLFRSIGQALGWGGGGSGSGDGY
jgi:hypothetical protein